MLTEAASVQHARILGFVHFGAKEDIITNGHIEDPRLLSDVADPRGRPHLSLQRPRVPENGAEEGALGAASSGQSRVVVSWPQY